MTAPPNRYRLATSLARPVARGWLHLADAEVALLVETVQQERDGTLGDCQAGDVACFKSFLLRQEIDRQHVARDLAAFRIRRLIKPLLAARRPSNTILAEAHSHNGEAGFPLTEAEVADLVRVAMYWAMPRERRHVG